MHIYICIYIYIRKYASLVIFGSDALEPIISPLHDNAAAELEANALAARWKTGEDCSAVSLHDAGEPPPELFVHRLVGAMMPFLSHTGLGVDNASTRAFSKLSLAALLALVRLYYTTELVGSWPAALRPVLPVLLPKTDGRRRLMGFLPPLIRIWMRTGSNVARHWESLNSQPCLCGETGTGAQRAA